jgi:bacillolysin
MKKFFLAGFCFFTCCEFLQAQKVHRLQASEKKLQPSIIEFSFASTTVLNNNNTSFTNNNDLQGAPSSHTAVTTGKMDEVGFGSIALLTKTSYSNKLFAADEVYSKGSIAGLALFTADLNYNKESGALNEGFSNIFGTAVQWREKPAAKKPPIQSSFSALNIMEDPNAYSQPNTYKGIYWYAGSADSGGVHTNCGVLNYWFYLLTSGGSGTNDKAFAYDISGIGINKARTIAYRTLVNYLNPASVYKDARTWSIKSAEDLYGIGSNEAQQTTKAWDAVGVTETTSEQGVNTAAFYNNASAVAIQNILNKSKKIILNKNIKTVQGNNRLQINLPSLMDGTYVL